MMWNQQLLLVALAIFSLAAASPASRKKRDSFVQRPWVYPRPPRPQVQAPAAPQQPLPTSPPVAAAPTAPQRPSTTASIPPDNSVPVDREDQDATPSWVSGSSGGGGGSPILSPDVVAILLGQGGFLDNDFWKVLLSRPRRPFGPASPPRPVHPDAGDTEWLRVMAEKPINCPSCCRVLFQRPCTPDATQAALPNPV